MKQQQENFPGKERNQAAGAQVAGTDGQSPHRVTAAMNQCQLFSVSVAMIKITTPGSNVLMV